MTDPAAGGRRGFDPVFLLESMRSFGYTTATAVADLVDNSLAAAATRVDIQFTWGGSAERSAVSVADNGRGMTEDALWDAMVVPSRDALVDPDSDDLGRFGLGMKTASWSMGRRMTVQTCSGQSQATACWDLDHVRVTGVAEPVDPDETGTDINRSLLRLPEGAEAGTCVLVEVCDRFFGEDTVTQAKGKKAFFEIAGDTRRRLEIAFHRFLGEGGVRISVNGEALTPWDPFFEQHDKTQRLPQEEVICAGEPIRVQPFVLPHRSHLSEEERETMEGVLGATRHQGFYVYRADRLIVPGGWFGAYAPKQRGNTKLARIAVDLTQTMDKAWNLNVLKSQARPPASLRSDFARIRDAVIPKATKVYNHRGSRTVGTGKTGEIQFVWLKKTEIDNATGVEKAVFTINREHRLVKEARTAAGTKGRPVVDAVLRNIESALPIAAILSEGFDDDERPRTEQLDAAKVAEEAELLYHLLRKVFNHEAAVATIAGQEPFHDHPGCVEALNELEES